MYTVITICQQLVNQSRFIAITFCLKIIDDVDDDIYILYIVGMT